MKSSIHLELQRKTCGRAEAVISARSANTQTGARNPFSRYKGAFGLAAAVSGRQERGYYAA